jgi:SAM-dependent methyltransferase
MTEQTHLAAIRGFEAQAVRPLFEPGRRLLEIGGANGYQAALLASWGLEVESIDLAGREKGPMHFPVRDYDGRQFPFEDDQFDYVFSSNVLEHIPDLDLAFAEMKRVARSGATFIHLLPTSAWRWWTNVAHWPFLFRRYVLGKRTGMHIAVPSSIAEGARKRGIAHMVKRALLPAAHGEYPNAIAELYYFSAMRWRREFRRHGFTLIDQKPAGIFYTGYGIAEGVGVEGRRRLARVLGSACTIFVMRAER